MNLEFLDAENEEVIVATFNQKEKDRLLKKSGPFGAPGGQEISNKSTILSEIDTALDLSKPPAVEYIFVEPATDLCVPLLSFFGFSRNPYGHAAVRYTLPDGTQMLMNIVGVPHKEMVNFLDPVEYLYGTGDFHNGAEQGGIYNRHMISVRLEEWPDERILELHEYFVNLKERTKVRSAKFSLLFSPLYNMLARILPGVFAERGNCARYTSKGLAEGGIISSASMWPKEIWVDIFEKEGRKNPKNVHVVSYRRINHAKHFYGSDIKSLSSVAPLEYLSNIFYFNLERFADVRVEVPEGETKAEVIRRHRSAEPSFFRYHHLSITAGVLLSGFWLAIAWTQRHRVVG